MIVEKQEILTAVYIYEKDEFEIGDIFIDEYKSENHHFICGKYRVFEKWSDTDRAAG